MAARFDLSVPVPINKESIFPKAHAVQQVAERPIIQRPSLTTNDSTAPVLVAHLEVTCTKCAFEIQLCAGEVEFLLVILVDASTETKLR